MPQPLDVVMGDELPKERRDAINAVRASGRTDDNSIEFWDRARRVQDICAEFEIAPDDAARACALIERFLSPDGEYGRMAVWDSDINRLIVAVAKYAAKP